MQDFSSWLAEPPYNWPQSDVNEFVQILLDGIDEDILLIQTNSYPHTTNERPNTIV